MQFEASKEGLLLHSELGSKEFAQSKLFSFLKEAGYLVRFEGEQTLFSPWFFTETQERNANHTKKMSIIGPGFVGKPFYDILFSANTAEILKSLKALQKAYYEAEKQNISLPNAGPFFILISENEILFLPQELSIRSLHALSETKRNEFLGRFINRSLQKEESLLFSFAVYAYTFLTGDLPFPSLDEEKRQTQIQYAVFIPLELYNPSFPQHLVQAIELHLKSNGKEEKQTSLFTEELTTFEEPKEHEKKALAKERSIWIQKKQKINNQYVFLKKNRFILLGFLVGLVIIILTSLSFIKDKKQEPNSVGLTDIQTIEAFYTGLNTLDVSLSSNLLYKKTKTHYTNLIASFHVVKMTRQSYEGINAFEHPVEKIKNGQHDGAGIFGLTELKVGNLVLNPFSSKAAKTQKNPLLDIAEGEIKQYLVHFYFIRNEGEDLYVEYCEDLIELIFHKNRWLIQSIVPSSDQEVMNYNEFLYYLEQVKNLSLEEKISYLKNIYQWVPSIDEIQLIQSESVHNEY